MAVDVTANTIGRAPRIVVGKALQWMFERRKH
jgi:hypothetical protein